MNTFENLFTRFIPACAGSTDRPALTAALIAVHPRVCGEHSMTVPLPDCLFGSSPRVRGALDW